MSRPLTLEMIGKARPLSQCGMEEIAIHQLTARPTGGILFARATERGHKDEARRYLVDLLGDTERFPKLKVLSMPGLDWRFETKLLGRREGDWAMSKRNPQRTTLTCIENDRAIYQGAVTRMPGMARHWKHHQWRTTNDAIRMETPPDWAECSISNRWVDRYHFANVDDLMAGLPRDTTFDAAWLDYTGVMTVRRLQIVQRFYQHHIRSGGVLAITALKARWSTPTVRAMDAAGGYSEWLQASIQGHVDHEISYSDTGSPMHQLCVIKP